MVVSINMNNETTATGNETVDGRTPSEWRQAAGELENTELFQRMPFFQAMQLLLGHKNRYFSAKIKLSEVGAAVNPKVEDIPESLLGEANFIEGTYEKGDTCLVLGEIPKAFLSAENLRDPYIEDEDISGYLPLKLTMHEQNLPIDKINSKQARGTGFKPEDLQATLAAQVQALQNGAEGKIQEMAGNLMRDIAEKRNRLSSKPAAGSFALADPSAAMKATAAAPIAPEKIQIKMEGFADMYDIELATPKEMVDMAPELWKDEKAAAKHLYTLKKNLAQQVEPVLGLTSDNGLRGALQKEFGHKTLDRRLENIKNEADEKLKEYGVADKATGRGR